MYFGEFFLQAADTSTSLSTGDGRPSDLTLSRAGLRANGSYTFAS